MLGSIWEGTEKKELAAPYYAKIVRDYPLSPLAPQAKDRLRALKAPVPQPDPKAVKWMTAEANAPRQHDPFVLKPKSLFTTGPREEKFRAAQNGTPTMTPESDSDAGLDILSGGNQSRIGGTGVVVTVSPGTTGSTEGAENVAPAGEANAPKPEAVGAPSTPGATPDAASKPDATAGAGTADPAATAGAGQTADGSKTDSATQADQTNGQTGNGDNKDNKKESSSKKKKGLKKIIPW
jgi:hypothetical protein